MTATAVAWRPQQVFPVNELNPGSSKAAAAATSGGKKAKRPGKPKKPAKLLNIAYDKGLAKQLEDRANSKLESLYHSLCTVRLEHAPLLAIGAWAFIEFLTALAGKDVNNDFLAFYSHQRLQQYGCGTSNKATGPILTR